MTKSWKTSLMGALSILGAAITLVVQPALAGEAVNWSGFIAALMAGIGLLFSRDNGVTSEQAGAK